MLRYIRYIMSNTAPALEENWWQVLYHSFIKKNISLTKLISSSHDEAYLADLSDKIDKSNICILFELLTNADIADI